MPALLTNSRESIQNAPSANPRRRTPRVLHVVPAIFGNKGVVGGAERYAFELARFMANETPTRLLAFGEQEIKEMSGLLTVRAIKPEHLIRGQQNNPWSPKLFGELYKADVVHCHQQHIVTSTVSALACRAMHKKVFVSDLGGGGWDLSSYISTDRLYHGHLHISRYSRKVSGHENKPSAPVIYGGVDTHKFSPPQERRRTSTVVYVGRLLPHKGIDYLVESIPPGVQLELIGKPYHPEFLKDLQTLANGKDVVFRHNCSDEEIVQAYRNALCVVLPSVYRSRYGEETRVPELLGQTLLEGMACGTPAICTDVASMPEVVENGVTGFVVPPNDPAALRERIVWLAEHVSQVDKMGQAGRERVLRHFTWQKVVDRCLDAYEQH